MTQEAFANFIYNNFLFDIPKILDLCVLYKENPVLSKIVQNILGAQKNYYNDFKICMRDIVKAIESSKKKLRNIFELDGIYSFDGNFSNKISNLITRTQKNVKEIFEIVYYLTDFVISLNNLIGFEPKIICDILLEEKFEHKYQAIFILFIFISNRNVIKI
jgi:activating signal cointegrator complex subunit 2